MIPDSVRHSTDGRSFSCRQLCTIQNVISPKCEAITGPFPGRRENYALNGWRHPTDTGNMYSCFLRSILLSGTGISPAPTLLGAPLSPGEVSPSLSPPAPRRSMAATSSQWSAARQPWNCSGSLPVSAAPSRPILRRCASSNPSCRSGAFPSTNRFAKGLRPSRRQGYPQLSLRCKLGDSPPLTSRPRSRRRARFHSLNDPFPIEEVEKIWARVGVA